MGDREREHRSERVHVAEERGLARDQREARDPSEHEDPDPGGAKAGVQLAELVGDLAVQAHRVDESRDPDDPGIGGDEQDRRRQQPDVDLTGVLERPEVQVLDDPEHRVAGEPSLVLGDAEQRLAVVPHATHRQRRQRDEREREVDREHRPHDALDRRRDRMRLVLGLLGHVRDRLVEDGQRVVLRAGVDGEDQLRGPELAEQAADRVVEPARAVVGDEHGGDDVPGEGVDGRLGGGPAARLGVLAGPELAGALAGVVLAGALGGVLPGLVLAGRREAAGPVLVRRVSGFWVL